MKKITLIISMITLSVGFSSTASAQAPASANAPTEATIVAPLTIAIVTPMNFGNFATSAAGGVLVLKTDNSRVESGGVKLTTTASIVPTAAKFLVEGEVDYTYGITMPSTLELTTASVEAGTKTMQVTDFKRAFIAGTDVTSDGTLALGKQDLYVGATLTAGASQAAGKYENAAGFAVTVNYN